MSDFISLHCPSCGGQLQFGSDAKVFFCTHCGTKLLYKDGGLINAIEKSYNAQADQFEETARFTSKQSSKEAIPVIEQEIVTTKASMKEAEDHGKNPFGLIIAVIGFVGGFGGWIAFTVWQFSTYGYANNTVYPDWVNRLSWEILVWGFALFFLGIVIYLLTKPKKTKEWLELQAKLVSLEMQLAKHKQNIIS